MRKKIGHIVLSLFLEDLMIFKSRYTQESKLSVYLMKSSKNNIQKMCTIFYLIRLSN